MMDVRETMSGSDALLWTVGRDPVLRPTVVAVLSLDRAPCWKDVRCRMEALTEAVPRFRSRVVVRSTGRGRPQFVRDDRFDLTLHLRRIGLPDGGGFREVLDLAQVMATTGFDAELAPWESVIVEGVDGSGAAFIIKLHHALVDGIGGVAVLMRLLDTARCPPPEPTPVGDQGHRRPTRGLLQRLPAPGKLIGAVRHACAHPLRQAAEVMATTTSAARLLAPAGKPISTLMGDRSFRRRVEVLDVDPRLLRTAATASGGTLNDVFVAAIVRGLVMYHQRHGVSIDRLRVLMPVNVRADGDPAGGNHFVPARFTVPAPSDPGACLRGVQCITASWKHAPGLGVSELLATGLDKLPRPVVSALWGSMLKGDDFCITNVPGPAFDTFLAGARVERMYAFAPPSGAALNVSLVTMADRACVGIIVDDAAVPDCSELASCLEAGFAELLRPLGSRSGDLP